MDGLPLLHEISENRSPVPHVLKCPWAWLTTEGPFGDTGAKTRFSAVAGHSDLILVAKWANEGAEVPKYVPESRLG